MHTKMITDEEILQACYASTDKKVTEMLYQLLGYRRCAREVIAVHNYRESYNEYMLQLHGLVRNGGCEWWRCDKLAQTVRIQASSLKPRHLCRAHADEGETKECWRESHPENVRWKQLDVEARAADRKRRLDRARLRAEQRANSGSK